MGDAEDLAVGRHRRNMRSAKSAGAILVLALHAGLLALLWRATIGRLPSVAPREQTIWLRLPPAPHAQKQAPAPNIHARHPPRSSPEPRAQPSAHRAITLPELPDVQDLGQLHGSVFNCAPEVLPNLSEDERARCRRGGAGFAPYDPNAVDYADHSDKVPGAQRWAREVARKNAPLLLACANPNGISPLYTAMCVAQGVAKGFDLEHKPEYFDKVEEAHVPNNGDPQPLH